eukprot:scaffold2200_cov413-Prasinococcus_capsulatus_cf.AAC.3
MEALKEVYAHWVPRDKIILANLWSAELAKLAANAFLAQRISSINAISALCEETGADVNQVAHAIGTDSRIGPKFLNSSVGFGGSCFEKDILNLVYISRTYGLNEVAHYWEQVIALNNYQKNRFVRRVVSAMFNSISGKRIAVLGFAFKKDTGDTRETPAIEVCRGLLHDGAHIAVYDPQVLEDQIYYELSLKPYEWDKPPPLRSALEIQKLREGSESVTVEQNPYKACENAHGICVLTEWDSFKSLDFQQIYDGMPKPAFIFDGRNVLPHAKLREIGFVVYCIGKPPCETGTRFTSTSSQSCHGGSAALASRHVRGGACLATWRAAERRMDLKSAAHMRFRGLPTGAPPCRCGVRRPARNGCWIDAPPMAARKRPSSGDARGCKPQPNGVAALLASLEHKVLE